MREVQCFQTFVGGVHAELLKITLERHLEIYLFQSTRFGRKNKLEFRVDKKFKKILLTSDLERLRLTVQL